MTLPTLPDDDADFTPELGRKIIEKYQEIVASQHAVLVMVRDWHDGDLEDNNWDKVIQRVRKECRTSLVPSHHKANET